MAAKIHEFPRLYIATRWELNKCPDNVYQRSPMMIFPRMQADIREMVTLIPTAL